MLNQNQFLKVQFFFLLVFFFSSLLANFFGKTQAYCYNRSLWYSVIFTFETQIVIALGKEQRV